MAAVEMTRRDESVAQLRVEAVRAADAEQARRVPAMARVLDGPARLLPAQACGVTGRRGATLCLDATRMEGPFWPAGLGLIHQGGELLKLGA
ncbi:MAG: hypothetical protein ACRECP_07455 [Methylocella sp.]